MAGGAVMPERATSFGPEYYAAHADMLGWGPGSRLDPLKLAFLQREVRGQRVLDVACGPGVYALALAGVGRRVVGVDFTLPLLGAAHGRASRFLAVCAGAVALPFRDRSFDTTLMLSILEHGDDVQLLREAARVTRSRLIIQVPLSEPAFLVEAGLLFSHWSDRSHLRTYTEAMLRDVVGAAGCRWLGMWPAFPRNMTALYISAMRLPRILRPLMQTLLRPFSALVQNPPAECFVVAEPAWCE